jgi:2-dehydropantoate 2-reductase
MRERGLRIESGAGNLELSSVRVAEDPREIGSAELVIIAVKLWDTEAAAKAVVPLVGRDTVVVSLQNGVEKDDVIAAIVGREHLVGGVTWIIARIAEPGVISHTGTLHRVAIGELDGSDSERVSRVVAAFAGSGVNSERSSDIRRATWEKFAFLASSSAVTAVTRLTVGSVREHPATRALLRDAIGEAAAVARAHGIDLPERFADEQLRFVDALPASGRASMANDLLHGGRLELDWLSGAVVRLGEAKGVATPVHRVLYAALALYADGRPGESGGA